MKMNRFAILLAGLILLMTGLSTAGEEYKYDFGQDHKVKKIKVENGAAGVLAQALAKETEQVQEKFAASRKALQILHEPGEAPAYLSNDVTKLVVDTRKDLDNAIQKVQPSGSDPLVAWVDDQFQQIQRKMPTPPVPIVSLPDPSAPRGGAVFASLRGFGLPMLAVAKPPKRAPAKPKPAPPKPKPAPPKAPQPPKPQTIPVATADRLLDQVKEVVSQIFVLAASDKLEVELWVGSTSPHAAFSFWSQGQLKESTLAPVTIRTDGKRNLMVGLYSYHAAWSKGGVTRVIEYPTPAGAPVAQIPSERLDLVKGSRFFCCRFDENYCHHVNNEKECRR
jgi:hypothetical protein